MRNKKILLVGGCGYIGSFLYSQLISCGHDVTVCDLEKRGNPLKIPIISEDYKNLRKDFLSQFDSVLWFAGHSSVGMSTQDPDGALKNNCLDLFNFAKLIPKETKFIYASSGSLYSAKGNIVHPSDENSLINIPSQNSYDISKFAFDYLATHFLGNYFGLRMGTLSGHSPNLRSELVFNAMNISAIENGYIKLKNENSWRTILFLDDLWHFIQQLIYYEHTPGFYNVGSYSCTIGQLAQRISKTWNAPIINEGDSSTYSFHLGLDKMHTVYTPTNTFDHFSKLCEVFIEAYKKSIPYEQQLLS